MSSARRPNPASVLQPFVDRQELAGAVTLIADKDQILSLECVGYSDIASQTPMEADALCWVASQTKPITGTALMMLVDEGLVDVEATVETYLPEFQGQMMVAEKDDDHVLLKKPAHPLTVRNCLNHTGGLPFLTPVELPQIDSLRLCDAAKLYAQLPLQSEPDAQYVYSNVGINIAGRIIEVVTGQLYEEFLQTRLFAPLGLTDTTFWPTAQQLTRLPKAYKAREENTGLEETSMHFLQYPLDSPKRYATPGGGLFSTAKEMARFCQMILRGGEWAGRRYLSPESVAQMTRRQTPPDLESYGLGWAVREEYFGHGGAYSTSMDIYPDLGIVAVFLVQHANFPGEGPNCRDAFREVVRNWTT